MWKNHVHSKYCKVLFYLELSFRACKAFDAFQNCVPKLFISCTRLSFAVFKPHNFKANGKGIQPSCKRQGLRTRKRPGRAPGSIPGLRFICKLIEILGDSSSPPRVLYSKPSFPSNFLGVVMARRSTL